MIDPNVRTIPTIPVAKSLKPVEKTGTGRPLPSTPAAAAIAVADTAFSNLNVEHKNLESSTIKGRVTGTKAKRLPTRKAPTKKIKTTKAATTAKKIIKKEPVKLKAASVPSNQTPPPVPYRDPRPLPKVPADQTPAKVMRPLPKEQKTEHVVKVKDVLKNKNLPMIQMTPRPVAQSAPAELSQVQEETKSLSDSIRNVFANFLNGKCCV
jgi:hypothetical protein